MFRINFKNSLIALLGLVAFAIFAPARAYSQDKVIVTNSTSEPVPTVAQGTTKVAGTILVVNTAAAGLSISTLIHPISRCLALLKVIVFQVIL